MAHSGNVRAILYALGANLAVAAAKFAAAGLTGSGAMLAEAVHSLADCGNQGLLFLGLARARRPPDADHPLGHGKALYFWSFVVALMLFSMGGLFSVYEGLHKLGHPGPGDLDRPWVAVAVLVLALVLEGASLGGALRETRSARRGKSLWRWFRSSRRSELLVVVGEDLGALLGLSLALAAVVLAVVTGDPAWDAWGSVAVGMLLIVIALAVAVEVKGLLIGESAGAEFERGVRSFLVAHPAVADVWNLITLQLGPDVMVAVKARMAPADSARALVEAINACEKDLKKAFPQVRWLFFEPDVLP